MDERKKLLWSIGFSWPIWTFFIRLIHHHFSHFFPGQPSCLFSKESHHFIYSPQLNLLILSFVYAQLHFHCPLLNSRVVYIAPLRLCQRSKLGSRLLYSNSQLDFSMLYIFPYRIDSSQIHLNPLFFPLMWPKLWFTKIRGLDLVEFYIGLAKWRNKKKRARRLGKCSRRKAEKESRKKRVCVCVEGVLGGRYE